MSFALDLALFVDAVTTGRNDLGFQREIAAGQANAIELQLHRSLAPKVARILGCFEMSDEVASARKRLLTEFGLRAQVAKYGVPDVDRGRGEVGFIQGTLQKSTGGQDNVPCAGAQA